MGVVHRNRSVVVVRTKQADFCLEDRRWGESSIHRGTGKRQDELQQNFGNDQKQSTESNRKRTHTKLFKMDVESRYK